MTRPANAGHNKPHGSTSTVEGAWSSNLPNGTGGS